MSETSVVALVAVVVGAVVSVASVATNLWFSNRARQRDHEARAQERREDYQEWYQRTLFEKRLQVVQEAYVWLMEFTRGLNSADPKNSGDKLTQRLKQLCLDARDWYDKSAVFLYDTLPEESAFIGLINAAFEYARGNPADYVWDSYHKADAEVRDRLREVMAVAPTERK